MNDIRKGKQDDREVLTLLAGLGTRTPTIKDITDRARTLRTIPIKEDLNKPILPMGPN
jgi:hypothetical protein